MVYMMSFAFTDDILLNAFELDQILEDQLIESIKTSDKHECEKCGCNDRCKNGGSCVLVNPTVSGGEYEYRCYCKSGFQGDNCDIQSA
ncbi:unnamed protein product [Didymodactylos carnosus]|uniref:EGF-like domain-containing protein n=1 Tax=Didymodactylos carnosus TaxID=1234261 RepID=A0A8S2ELM8_9BILA|nr:unnamed protein product [Didymodactylos carnosus]CAF3991055.1 unnamed protein product [Didymodactylos carnosus]